MLQHNRLPLTALLGVFLLLAAGSSFALGAEDESFGDQSAVTTAVGFQKGNVKLGKSQGDKQYEELSMENAKPLPPARSEKISSLISEIVEPEASIEVERHRSKLIRTKAPVTRFSITEPKTVDVVQFTPTEFELIGLKAGETTMTLWFGDKRALRYIVKVSSDTEPVKRIEREYRILQDKINEMFPNSSIQLVVLADKLIVRGQARDSAEATQILSMLTGGPGAAGDINAGRTWAGRNVNMGRVASPGPGSDVPAQDLINLLTVPGEQQIMLKVRIAQLDRSAARDLANKFRINSGILAMNTWTGGASTVFSSVMTPQDLTLALTASSSNSYTKLLAEPNLVTLNGQSASFHSGGKFPVPTAVGIGGVSGINTQFQSYGTELTFTPTIIDKDRIRLEVSPSHSTVNKALVINQVPSTFNRGVNTTVDMRTGQWLAIAGLLEDSQKGSKISVPFLGDIPVVGAMFGQTNVKRDETELIILVSPELVHPMDAQETPLILPGMEITEPGDAAFFFGGAYLAKYETDGTCGAACRQQSYEQADGQSEPASRPNQARALTPEERRQSIGATMSRPDFQRSESYYMYGPHGASQ